MKQHNYETQLRWSGSTGSGYRGYDRNHELVVAGNTLRASADPAFLGDPALPNPEQLLLAAASSCQMLSFLALAALAKLDVVHYEDNARAVMPETGVSTQITEIDLNIKVTVKSADEQEVLRLMESAHEQCFIANTLKATVNIHTTVAVIV
ncbi:OsmC family protein [Leucobacter coleopterorum]|uniref:OsmC family protein n=1 Tax=Leucobacter coleopterorum TaxID=2714933 RepID=A0ABX6JWB6_9MICO|nr:OsmC family protein [Leucobacter coleopterorum]QIM18598.1 OsmC family protein [Leucobacter coleopterorum]